MCPLTYSTQLNSTEKTKMAQPVLKRRPEKQYLSDLRRLAAVLVLLLVASSYWVSVFFLTDPQFQFIPNLNSTTTTTTTTSDSAQSLPLPLPVPVPDKKLVVSTTKEEEELRINAPSSAGPSPYHDWDLFASDFKEMLHTLKIYVYPDVYRMNAPFAAAFLPHPNPSNPKLGNYYSEHMFKVSLLRSTLVTPHPQQAHFFFLPFSINALRNDPRVRSEASISQFVAQYTNNISHQFGFWNASKGADHFFVSCHSVGREAASHHSDLHNNAIQVTCSSSYFQRLYITRKDFGLPQVWPRPPVPQLLLNPPHARHKLVFFAGRMQNSNIRQQLIALWGNDTSLDIFSTTPPYPYEDGFRKSKYCLHLKGYEVNTARVSDSIHYGCIPVIISNYYDLPFANVLDWSKFSVIITQADIAYLKRILLSISTDMYLAMYNSLCLVRKHFVWHTVPRDFDSFHMTAYQLWLRRRSTHHLSPQARA